MAGFGGDLPGKRLKSRKVVSFGGRPSLKKAQIKEGGDSKRGTFLEKDPD
ncbi:MAG: hypothetical protein KBS55_04175 [Bacteroidales bacterium]|nr:hypothetical protein [Candidatus Cryptobacteroides aphodequi]